MIGTVHPPVVVFRPTLGAATCLSKPPPLFQTLRKPRSGNMWQYELCGNGRSVPVKNSLGENRDSLPDGDEVENKKVSIDLNALEGASRRSMLVGFTCDACGGRTERLVNPLAWAKGMVIVQCEHCKAWHKIADANNMVEEYRFDCSDDE